MPAVMFCPDPHIFMMAYERRVEQFQSGTISPALFRTHLYCLGLRGEELETELKKQTKIKNERS